MAERTYQKQIGNNIYQFKAPDDSAGQASAMQEFARIEAELQSSSQSGAYNAFLAGLSNDESARVQWLAQKRFPESENPVSRYYIDEDGDIAYFDISGKYGNRGKSYKEFGSVIDTFGLDKDEVFGLVGPAFTFAAEVGGQMYGMGKGAVLGIPFGPAGVVGGAIAGGATGSTAATAGSNMLRAGLSMRLGGPESDMETAVNDIVWSAGFGAVPFGIPARTVGAGIKQTLPVSMHWLVDKFPGPRGKIILREILEEGGEDVDEIIRLAQARGVPLTRAEAQFGAGRASQVQGYLQQQESAQKFHRFYMDRAARVETMVRDFADELLSGKYVPQAIMRGGARVGQTEYIDSTQNIAQATTNYLEEAKQQRIREAGEIYQKAYAADAAGSDDVAGMIDNILNGEAIPGSSMDGAPLPGINVMLQDPNLNPTMRTYFTNIRNALYDKSTGPSPRQILRETNAANRQAGRPAITMADAEEIAFSNYKPLNTTQDVHNVIKNDLRAMTETLASGMGEKHPSLSAIVPQIKQAINNGLKAHNPLYADANKIYNPDMGIVDFTQMQIVRNLAKAAEVGGPDSVRVVKNMFAGNAKPDEIIELKRVIQSEDPQLWQSMKADWLTTQWDEVVMSTTNPLGQPNKLLSRLGVQGQDALEETGESLAKQAQVYEAIFEPEELANFSEVTQILQAVRSLQTQVQSATVPWAKLRQQIFDEAQNAGHNVSLLQPLLMLPNKIRTPVRAVLGSTGERMQRETADIYEDFLTEALVNPNKAEELRTIASDINQRIAFWGQASVRGTAAALLQESDEARQQAIDLQEQVERERAAEDERLRLIQEQQPDPNLGARIDSASPATLNLPLFEDAPDTGMATAFDPAMSPTILPRAADRELALRSRARQSGIAGLV